MGEKLKEWLTVGPPGLRRYRTYLRIRCVNCVLAAGLSQGAVLRCRLPLRRIAA